METEVRRLTGRSAVGLGNFLSGMETLAAWRPWPESHALGNFLSGMETDGKEHSGPHDGPWKLP